MYDVDLINKHYLDISESTLQLAIELQRQGDHIRLKALGIDPKFVRKISQYPQNQLTKLCQSTAPFIAPGINNRALELAIKQFEDDLQRENIYEQLLIHGATLSFVEEHTTLDKHEFSRRRKRLGLHNVGNPKSPSEDNCLRIDMLWSQLPDNMPVIEKYLFTAQKLEIQISSILVHHRSMGIS